MATTTVHENHHVFQIKETSQFWDVIKGNVVPLPPRTEKQEAAAAAFAAANPTAKLRPTSIPSRKFTVVDAFAEWCGPCKAISPQFQKWSELGEYNELINFIKIDVDELAELSQELGIRAMPTFMFFKGEQKVDTVLGANPPALKKALDKYRDLAATEAAAEKKEEAPVAAAEKKEEAPAATPESATEKKEDAPAA